MSSKNSLDWLVRSYAPAFCDLHPELKGHGEALRGLPAIADQEGLPTIQALATARSVVAILAPAKQAARRLAQERAAEGGEEWQAAFTAGRKAALGAMPSGAFVSAESAAKRLRCATAADSAFEIAHLAAALALAEGRGERLPTL